MQLGWQHDGIVCFILSGKQGCFSTSNPPRDWMQQNLRTLGLRALHKICLPGTHDAGMGEITHTDIVPEDLIATFTQTQSLKILGRLQMGQDTLTYALISLAVLTGLIITRVTMVLEVKRCRRSSMTSILY